MYLSCLYPYAISGWHLPFSSNCSKHMCRLALYKLVKHRDSHTLYASSCHVYLPAARTVPQMSRAKAYVNTLVYNNTKYC